MHLGAGNAVQKIAYRDFRVFCLWEGAVAFCTSEYDIAGSNQSTSTSPYPTKEKSPADNSPTGGPQHVVGESKFRLREKEITRAPSQRMCPCGRQVDVANDHRRRLRRADHRRIGRGRQSHRHRPSPHGIARLELPDNRQHRYPLVLMMVLQRKRPVLKEKG